MLVIFLHVSQSLMFLVSYVDDISPRIPVLDVLGQLCWWHFFTYPGAWCSGSVMLIFLQATDRLRLIRIIIFFKSVYIRFFWFFQFAMLADELISLYDHRTPCLTYSGIQFSMYSKTRIKYRSIYDIVVVDWSVHSALKPIDGHILSHAT